MTRHRSAAPFPFAIAIALGAAGLALAAAGCRKGERSLAELKDANGDVTRDTASTPRAWVAAKPGASFAMGDALRTGASSDASLHLASGATIAVASDSTLRFARGAKPTVAIEEGDAIVEADTGEVDIQTSIGVAHLEAGGKAHVSATGGASRFEVTLGEARIDREDGGSLAVGKGESLDLTVGGAIVEHGEAGAHVEGPSPDAGGLPAADAASPAPADVVTIEVHGAGARMVAHGETASRALAEGSRAIDPGDAIDAPPGATVDVRRGGEHGRLVGTGHMVIGEPGSPLVRGTAGRIELDADTGDVAIEVPGGVVIAHVKDGRSRLVADVAANGTKVGVRQGEAEVRGKAGSETVRAGETASVSSKGAVVVGGRSAERSDFTVRAGDSFTVRDPHPPTAIAFDFSSLCPGPAVITHPDGSGARGDHKAVLSLGAGSHTLGVHCIGPDGVEDQAAASGTVTVIRDAARAELPRAAPSTVVDTDGRKYTVMYQNLQPSVVARWREGTGDAFVLHLDGQTFKSNVSRKELAPGTVVEGTHTLWFETADGSKRSAETTLVLRFDNAAPTASVREPVDGAFHAGDKVRVAGVVVEGWSVMVNGQPAPLDEQKRFSAEATVPASDDALVLRLAHAKRGVVYYVRHVGAPLGAKP